MSEMTPGPGGRQKTTFHIIILVVVTAVCLLPFAGKAFHIDDPLFIWAARQIQSSPLDFYGFDVNWNGYVEPMSEVMKNPPIASYYIAVVASVAGWSEFALHLAFLLPAFALAAGTYFLARRFTSMPLYAALAALLTPVFLVSATTVMSDVMMLAFWCWAVVLWLRGTDRDEPAALFAASVLIVFSALTKYFGISLIPLLTVYSLLKGHRIRRWAPCMLVPVVILAGYQWATIEIYGRGLLFDAAGYAVSQKAGTGMSYIQKGSVSLSFTGGCVVTAFFYAPLLWSRRSLVLWAVLTIVIGFALVRFNVLEKLFFLEGLDVNLWLSVQCVIFAVAGINLLAVSVADLLHRRDASSVLLFLWIIGTVIFAGFLNWSTNGRSILPMVPAAGILLMRGIERRYGSSSRIGSLRLLLPLIPALFIAVMVAWADYGFANSSRTAASVIYKKYGHRTERLLFQGHWGFQYYMEKAGAKAADINRTSLKKGDIVVIPLNNTELWGVPASRSVLVDMVRHTTSSLFATLDVVSGAGFYSDFWGPLPYAVGPKFQDTYLIYLIKSG